VVITSTGGVTKRILPFAAPVDAGLASWAASYLNERLVGLGLGARMLHNRLRDPSLTIGELGFINAIAPVFTELEYLDQETVYVDGASRLLQVGRFADVSELNALMDMLERRVTLIEALRLALGERDVLVRIGAENTAPAFRSLVLVAAGYGLPQRRLGTVSVIGPMRMDYGAAIHTVRDAAAQLSRFVADIYDER
jgi:heat-inducible transcriptional repressor